MSTNPLYKNYDFAGFRAVNAQDPVDDQDYVTKAWGLANLSGGGVTPELQVLLNSLILGSGGSVPGAEALYINTGGQGDRTASITVTRSTGMFTIDPGTPSNLVNGTASDSPQALGSGAAVASKVVTFQFPSPVYIAEVAANLGAGTNGFWKFQVSQDGISWADVTGSFEFKTPSGTASGGEDPDDPVTDNLFTVALATNKFAWAYYRMLGVSGTVGTYWNEFYFKIYGL